MFLCLCFLFILFIQTISIAPLQVPATQRRSRHGTDTVSKCHRQSIVELCVDVIVSAAARRSSFLGPIKLSRRSSFLGPIKLSAAILKLSAAACRSTKVGGGGPTNCRRGAARRGAALPAHGSSL